MVEVAYSESEHDVLRKVQDFWLSNHSRVHDAIVVKIDQVAQGETPTRMQVSYIPKLQVLYYCLYNVYF